MAANAHRATSGIGSGFGPGCASARGVCDGPDGAPPSRRPNVAQVLRERTRPLHQRAERSGVIRDIVSGTADSRDYALYLRNIYAAYRALERGLAAASDTPIGHVVNRHSLVRSERIATDLRALAGPAWPRMLPLLPAGRRYAERVSSIVGEDALPLAAHAYVRYLGDLSGGQILARRLARSMGLRADEMRWLAFPEIADVAEAKSDVRAALDRMVETASDLERLAAEAERAFALNIDVSQNVLDAARPT